MVYLEDLGDLEAPVKTQAMSGASLGSSAGGCQHCSTAWSSWIRMQEIVTEVKEKSIKTWSPDPSNQQNGLTQFMWSFKCCAKNRVKGQTFRKHTQKGSCPGAKCHPWGQLSDLFITLCEFDNTNLNPCVYISQKHMFTRVHLSTPWRVQSSAVDQWALCMSAAVTLGTRVWP